MAWSPYRGDVYLDLDGVESFCRELAEASPEWVTLESVGQSRQGRPILLLTLSRTDGDVSRRPAVWVDGGTHAAEFAGVMATLYAVSRWVEALRSGDAATVAWFSTHAAHVLPCISPDGFDAMCSGAPFLRSTLRPPRPGTVRAGMDPCDVDGDGVVRWMRWRHPAGPFVPDPELPVTMRPRTLDDDPAEAYFVCDEGLLVQWDGASWSRAPRTHALDLNRNFPGSWAPFAMFDMDGGAFALSEPESRAVVDAFAARPFIGAALTNHTYTGCLLTQPYRQDSPLPEPDLDLMHHLAKEAVQGTAYKVYKVNPEFTYDPRRPIVGVWADTIATLFGVPGYTLELWDPFAAAGLKVERPMDMFMRPDPASMRQVFAHFFGDGEAVSPWRPFDHPQLGAVEIGGIDYLRTIRNPPVEHLAAECQDAFLVTERLRRALPELRVTTTVRRRAGVARVEVHLENLGYLPTSALAHGAQLQSAPASSVRLRCEGSATVVCGASERTLEPLEGWGQSLVGAARNPIYPGLPVRGHRASVRFDVEGTGAVEVAWIVGRSGEGRQRIELDQEVEP